jgi:tetratricopeptide (TPR) repeat protein
MGSLTYFFLGEVYFDKGEYEKSQNYFQEGISLLEEGSLWPSFNKLYKMALARTKVMRNETDIDLESLYGYEGENTINILEGWMQRYIGEILLNIHKFQMNETKKWIIKAIESDKRNNMMWHLGRDYALYAELFKREGNHSKAKENLIKAIEILKECGADGWVEKYEKELTAFS